MPAMTKVAGPGTVYPGFLGPAVTVGQGTTKKLTGMLILSTTEFPDATSGVPELGPDRERAWRRGAVEAALQSLQQPVDGPQVFEY